MFTGDWRHFPSVARLFLLHGRLFQPGLRTFSEVLHPPEDLSGQVSCQLEPFVVGTAVRFTDYWSHTPSEVPPLFSPESPVSARPLCAPCFGRNIENSTCLFGIRTLYRSQTALQIRQFSTRKFGQKSGTAQGQGQKQFPQNLACDRCRHAAAVEHGGKFCHVGSDDPGAADGPNGLQQG